MKKIYPIIKDYLTSDGPRSALVRDGLISLVLKAGYILLTFGTTVALARFLGAGNYGIYTYVFAWITIISIPAQFGLPTLVTRETAQAIARNEYGLVQGIWRWSGKFVIMLGVSLLVFSLVAVQFMGANFTGEYLRTFYWGLALVLLIALSNLRGAALRGLHHMIEGLLPEQVMFPGFFILFLGAGALFGYTITASGAMSIQVAAGTLTFFFGVVMLWRATPQQVRTANPVYDNRRWLSSTLPLALVDGMSILNNQVGIVILGLFTAPADVGLFRVASQVSALTSVGLVAINSVVAPRFARMYADGDMDRLQQLAIISARAALAITIPLALFFLITGKSVLSLFFGAEFEPSYMPMVILTAGQLVNSFTGSVGYLLNMSGHERDTAFGMGVAVVVNIGLLLWLAPSSGITGAAIAGAISLAVWNVLLWIAVRRRLNIKSLAFDLPARKKIE